MSEAQPEHQNIGEAWLAIMKDIGYVQKKGLNKAQNYKYAGEAQLIEALRPVLLEHDVICVPGEVNIHLADCTVVDDKKTFRIVATYTYVYTHVPSNTHMQVMAIGEGVDTGDKSAYKAATGALKYSLRQPFLIETGDDPEKDAEEEKKEPAFKNSALRKTFFDNVTRAFELSLSDKDLDEAVASYRADFTRMDNGSEHDLLAVGELRKRYVRRKQEIALERKADNGDFENFAEEVNGEISNSRDF